MRELLNASFAELGYYTEIDEDEFAYQVARLDHLIDERIALYLFKDGRADRDSSSASRTSRTFVRKVNGDLGLLNQLRLLADAQELPQRGDLRDPGDPPRGAGQGLPAPALGGVPAQPRERPATTRCGGRSSSTGNVASSSYGDRLGRARTRRRLLYARRRVTDLRQVEHLEPHLWRAPSAHNTQPWVVTYAPDRIELRFNPERALPAGDPTRRDLPALARGLRRGRAVSPLRAPRSHSSSCRASIPGRYQVGELRAGRGAVRDLVHARRPRASADEPAPVRRGAPAAERGSRKLEASFAADAELHQVATRELVDLRSGGRPPSLRVARRGVRAAHVATAGPSPLSLRAGRAELRLPGARAPRGGGPGRTSPARRLPGRAWAASPSPVQRLHDEAPGTRRQRARADGDRRYARAGPRARALAPPGVARARTAWAVHPSPESDSRLPRDGTASSPLASRPLPGHRLLCVFRVGRSEPPPRSARRNLLAKQDSAEADPAADPRLHARQDSAEAESCG